MKKAKNGFIKNLHYFCLIAVIALGLIAIVGSNGGGGGDGGGTTTTIEDTTAPTVSSTSPASDATGVAIDTTITATFSEAMDSTTITATTFSVTAGDGTSVSGTVTYSDQTATFTPSSDLQYVTTYTASISASVKSAAGVAMESEHSWSFTTANNQWVRLLGTNEDDVNLDVAVDDQANVYVVGITQGDLAFKTNNGGSDGFVAKYDKYGVLKWVRLIGSSGDDIAYGVAVDSNGNVYVSGVVAGDIQGESVSGDEDAFLAKYDQNGTQQWIKVFGTNSPGADYQEETANAVAVGSDDSVYVAGATFGNLDGQTNAGAYDIFVCKYSQDGSRVWTQLLGTACSENPNDIAVDVSGTEDCIYVTGHSRGHLDGQTNSGTVCSSDVFLTKYTSGGVKQWTRLLGQSQDNDVGYGVAAQDGKIYLTGVIMFQTGGLTAAKIFVAYYDASGNQQACSYLGSDDLNQAGYDIDLDSDGNVYLTGYTWAPLAGQGDFTFHHSDAFVVKYSPELAAIEWVEYLGDEADMVYGQGVAIDTEGTVHVTGDTDSDLTGSSKANGVWLNDGSGTFSDSGQSLGDSPTYSIALGDVDGDGDLDIVSGNSGANKVWLNDGSGTFSDSGQSLGYPCTYSIALGDVDGDGDLDIVSGNSGANKVWVNDGSGTFSDLGQSLGSSSTIAVELADIDADGDPDIVAQNWNDAHTAWENDGSGTFTELGQVLESATPSTFDAGEVDGDGDIDIVTGYSGGHAAGYNYDVFVWSFTGTD